MQLKTKQRKHNIFKSMRIYGFWLYGFRKP